MEALSAADVFLFEEFRLDPRGLWRRNEVNALASVEIGSRALEVLRVLLERPGVLFSRDEIMAIAWPRMVVEDNNLNVQISTLRRVLDQHRANGSCIQTVPGRGYRFVTPVTRVEGAAPPEPSSSPGNGFDEAIPRHEQAQAVGASGKKNGPALAMPKARYRLWVGAVATAIGALILTTAVGTWRIPWPWKPPPAPHLSIVVLPFANLGGDPEQQYFADGITEDVTFDLSRIVDMFVISRNTAFAFRNKPINTKQIGRELGGDAYLLS